MARRGRKPSATKEPKFHREAVEEVYEMLQDMIEKHHPRFEESQFLILMKHGGWTSKGKTQFGKFKVLGDDLRTSMDKDAILHLNAQMWNKMSEPQQRYVLDNALFALDTKSSKDGDTITAPDGRPLLKTLPPDIEAFVEVIKRHGTTTEDVKRLAAAIKEVNPDQLTIEDVIGAGKQQGGADQKEPGNGLEVRRNPDGSVDTVDDPNQTKIEDFTGDPDDKEGPPMPNDADSLPL